MKLNEDWNENKSYKWTRVHFETIGDIISSRDSEDEREELAIAFIERLKDTNPAFDETRFRKACAVRTKIEQHKVWRQ